MKNLIRRIKGIPFQFQESFNSIYKKQSQFVINSNKEQKSIQYHPNSYPQLDKFFMKFANSKPQEGRVSGKSLAFVIGAQNVGKTQFIHKNLNQLNKKILSCKSQHFSFQNKLPSQKSSTDFDGSKSPEYYESQKMQEEFESGYQILIKRDYEKEGDLNFINFVEDLHQQIMSKIIKVLRKYQQDELTKNKIRKPDQKQNEKESNILTSEIVKQVALSITGHQYLYIHLKDVVFAILEEKDPVRLSKEGMNLLQEFNSDYLQAGRCESQLFFSQHFLSLINLIHQHKLTTFFTLQNQLPKLTNNSLKTITTLQFLYSIYQRIEYENRPPQFQFSSFKSGIQTTDFLFEVTNFLTGLGKYLQNIQKELISLPQTQKQQWKSNLLNQNNYILNGNYVNTLLCLTNFQHLLCFKTRQPSFLNWIDHVILRSVTPSGFRHHFPIILQIPNRRFLDELLQLGKIEGSNPVIIEIPGYLQSFLKYSNLSELFEQKRAIKLFERFGRNPHTWKKAIEDMAKGVDIEVITSGQAEYQEKQKLIVESKLNRVYTDEKCLKLLNQNTLDYQIMEVIKMFGKIKGMGRAQLSFIGTVLYKQPHFQAMLQNNIFWHGYYLPYMDYSCNLPSFLSSLSNIRGKIIKNNSYVSYIYWKYFVQEYRLSLRDIRYKKVHEKIMIENDNWGRQYVDLQLSTTYYGPLRDYKVQYSVKTKKMSIAS